MSFKSKVVDKNFELQIVTKIPVDKRSGQMMKHFRVFGNLES